MALDIKYRLGELAKDFGMANKEIIEILGKYFDLPKVSHSLVLENDQLDMIFEYLTQNNQVENIADIFNVSAEDKAKSDAEGEKKAQAQQDKAPAQPQKETKQEKPKKDFVPRQVPEKRIIDTRGGQTANLDKYNDRYEELGGNHANRANKQGTGKEKIQSKSKQKSQQQAASAKKRQEERDKLTKIQLERDKKQQLKVEIPDEISVGELASRMKKSAAEVMKCLMKNGVFASVSDVIDFDTA